MALSTKDSGRTMRSQGMGSINGLTVVNIWVTGKLISWMTLAFTPGKMGECTKDSILKTRSMATECTPGVTRRDMLDGGVKANNMALASSLAKRVRRN